MKRLLSRKRGGALLILVAGVITALAVVGGRWNVAYNTRSVADGSQKNAGANLVRPEALSAPAVTEHPGELRSETEHISKDVQRNFVSGTVVDGGSSPVADAQILLQAGDVAAVTDSNGRFDFPSTVGRDRLLVTVVRPGFVQTAAWCMAGRDETIRLRAGVAVRGRVLQLTDTGALQPLANQLLRLRAAGDEVRPPVQLVSDAAGAFIFCEEGGAWVQAEVILAKSAPWVETFVMPQLDGERDIVLPSKRNLCTITVSDAHQGTALAGSTVECNGYVVGVTGADGRLELDTYACEVPYEVHVRHGGYCDSRESFSVALDQTDVAIDIKLYHPAELLGRVVDESGFPIGGATVRVVSAQGMLRGSQRGTRTKSSPGIVGVAAGRTAVTGVGGEFKLDGIGSEYGSSFIKLEVNHPSYAVYRLATWIEVPNGTVFGPVVCQLVRGATIHGTVKANGIGARAAVFVAGADKKAYTNDRGEYELHSVAPGDVVLRARLDDHPCIWMEALRTVGGGEAAVVDMNLDFVWAAFYGTVATADGNPIADVPVKCEATTLEPDWPSTYEARTDLRGYYTVRVPVGAATSDVRYSLGLHRWEDDCAVRDLERPTAVDLVCTASAVIVICPVDNETGETVGYFDVIWRPAGEGDGMPCEAKRDLGAGRFAVEVPSGFGKLSIVHATHRVHDIKLTLVAGEERDLGRVELAQLTQ